MEDNNFLKADITPILKKVIPIILGLTAVVFAFFVSKAALSWASDNLPLFGVEAGEIITCSNCGKELKNTVNKINVPFNKRKKNFILNDLSLCDICGNEHVTVEQGNETICPRCEKTLSKKIKKIKLYRKEVKPIVKIQGKLCTKCKEEERLIRIIIGESYSWKELQRLGIDGMIGGISAAILINKTQKIAFWGSGFWSDERGGFVYVIAGDYPVKGNSATGYYIYYNGMVYDL